MSEEPSQLQQMKPYLIASAVLLIILLIVVFWPSADEDPTGNMDGDMSDSATVVAEPADAIMPEDTDMVEPEVFTPPQTPSEVQIGADNADVDEFEVEEVPVDVPLDISDASVKAALIEIATSPTVGRLLVNDNLIQKFVINVNNLAEAELSPKDALVAPPEEKFKTYNQADRIWIDNASFQRYTPYVDALETLEPEDLLKVYENYEPVIKEKFAEISRPGTNFDSALVKAIDELLDTPQVPVPIEVYSDSVMFKFADERLENLTAPQKQLLRTGPDNMRRIKDILRELKSELEARE